MITPTGLMCEVPTLDFDLLKDQKAAINAPSGDFFYDPWTVLDTFKNTDVEKLLSILPPHGEARIIRLKPGESYMCHADIDDRYHLNITGNKCYLIDLVENKMYPTVNDNSWYLMDAGRLHSASNFGDVDRYQLVVRSLLTRHHLKDPVRINLAIREKVFNIRYIFDNTVSPWLNWANKHAVITDFFRHKEDFISMSVERSYLLDLKATLPSQVELIQI